LIDGESSSKDNDLVIREISPSMSPLPDNADAESRFDGFTPILGWGPQEGPVPEAFLPSFHWGHFPHSLLRIDAAKERVVNLHAEALTYVENQSITVSINEVEIGSLLFTRVNQKETLLLPLTLPKGSHTLTLKYSNSLVKDYDKRQLAVLFLSLRISQ
jgi:hypothetical protein